MLEHSYLELIENKPLSSDSQAMQFVAYDVPSAEVAASINELTHGNLTPSLLQKVNDAIAADFDSIFTQTSNAGQWTVKLYKNGQGSWTVSSGL